MTRYLQQLRCLDIVSPICEEQNNWDRKVDILVRKRFQKNGVLCLNSHLKSQFVWVSILMSMYPPKWTPNFRCVSTPSDLWCFPNNKLAPQNYVPNHILTFHFTSCFLASTEPRWSASSGPRGGRSQQWKIIYLFRSIEVWICNIYNIAFTHKLDISANQSAVQLSECFSIITSN